MAVIPVSSDSYVNQSRASGNFGSSIELLVNGGAGTNNKEIFFFVKPPPKGVTVLSAIFKIRLKGAWASTNNLTLKRVTDTWAESKVNWNNKPASVTTNQQTALVSSGVDKQVVSFDITALMQDVAAANIYTGLTLVLTEDQDRKIYSSEEKDTSLRPTLEMTWVEGPNPPTNLNPSGGQAVSIMAPVLQWIFRNKTGDTGQSSSQVQVSTKADFSTVEYDSGKVANVANQWDLGAVSLYPGTSITLANPSAAADDIIDTTGAHGFKAGDKVWFSALTGGSGLSINTEYYVIAANLGSTTFQVSTTPGGSAVNFTTDITAGTVRADGIVAGETKYWRVQVWDTADVLSGYSDPVSFTRTVKGTLTITNPPAPASNQVDETGPLFTWTFSGATQESVEVVVYQVPTTGDPVEIYRAERFVTTGLSWEIPALLQLSTTYRLRLRVYDTVNRPNLPGDPDYVEATRDFTYQQTGGPTAVGSFVATVTPGDPVVLLSWTRASAPDYFCLVEDGVKIYQRLIPSQLFVSGTTYNYRYIPSPRVSKTVSIESVVDTAGVLKHSNSNPSAAVTTTPVGIWLIDRDDNKKVQILGQSDNQLVIPESGATYKLLNRRQPVRIVDGVNGYEGTIEGLLGDKTSRDDFLTLRSRLKELILVIGDLAIPVRLEGGNTSPRPVPSDSTWLVSFGVFQTGAPWPVSLPGYLG